jgi:hypothetical protein
LVTPPSVQNAEEVGSTRGSVTEDDMEPGPAFLVLLPSRDVHASRSGIHRLSQVPHYDDQLTT